MVKVLVNKKVYKKDAEYFNRIKKLYPTLKDMSYAQFIQMLIRNNKEKFESTVVLLSDFVSLGSGFALKKRKRKR